jgi:uncharacterized membrane protein YdjX (TVP38/TMEM64 family)
MRSALAPVGPAIGFVVAIWLVAAAAGWDDGQVATWVPSSAAVAALVIVVLLVLDVVAPLPGSVLMVAAGSALGPIAGTGVNAVGLLGAFLVGQAIGAAVARPAASPRHPMSPVLVAATRGFPVAGEAVALAAGAAGGERRTLIRAAAAGSLLVGGLYAVVGAQLGATPLLVIVGTVGAAALQASLVWVLRKRSQPV